MFGILIYDILFFLIPMIVLTLFFGALILYFGAKKQNQKAPGTVSEGDMKTRKIFLIITGIAAGVLLAVVLGFMALLFMAVAFM